MNQKQFMDAVLEITNLEKNLSQNNDLIYAHTKNEFEEAKKDWGKLGSSIATNIEILDMLKTKYNEMLLETIEEFNPVEVKDELKSLAKSFGYAQDFLNEIANADLTDKAQCWGAVDNCLDGWASISELDEKIEKTHKIFKQIESYALKKDQVLS